MATRDATKIDRGPGRLILNPTNLAAAGPTYGGTELGAVRGIDVEFMRPMWPVPAEEYGGAPVEIVEGADWAILYCLIRQWDGDALSAIFPNVSGSGASKIVTGDADGTVRAGHLGSSRAAKVLFVPDNATDHRAFYLPKAVPVIVAPSRTAFSILKESVFEVSWLGLPDATMRSYQAAKIANLTL